MDKPKRFFECLLPVTVCNLKCPYCYIIQENRRSMEMAKLDYPPRRIVEALRKERVGGCCWISICGAGETLAQEEIIEIVDGLLNEGHYVNITTNGTMSKRLRDLLEQCKNNVKHLHFSFSFHYTELIRLNLLNSFFENITLVKASGASVLFQMNLCDEYIPYIDEIKKISMEKVGEYPQVALTRDESERPFKIWTKLADEKYYEVGRSFDSELFEFTYKNFNVKRKEFCYAGDWSFVLNLKTGWLSKCYANSEGQNIFKDIDEPIRFSAIGKKCNNIYCVNSSHFMALGIIPELNTPSYAQLRCRAKSNLYSEEMFEFLNHKLSESNSEYSVLKKMKYSWVGDCCRRLLRKIKKILKRKTQISRL